MGVSYRVSFGSDPIASAGGGVFGSFASVPGAIHLDEAGDMEVSRLASSLSSRLTMYCYTYIWGGWAMSDKDLAACKTIDDPVAFRSKVLSCTACRS